MIFGNSRGQAEIPREDEWAYPLLALLEAAGCDGYGWPKFENATFMVQGYDWDAECDCGFDEIAEKWHDAHPHSPECYDTVCAAAMAAWDEKHKFKELEKRVYGDEENPLFQGMNVEHTTGPFPGIHGFVMTPRHDELAEQLRAERKKRDRYQDDLRKRLCGERGLTYPDGCAVHCDCYKEKAAQEFFAAHDDAPTCRRVQPNFLYKPTGFKANWYKYPLRDSYMTPPVTNDEWRAIMSACMKSVAQ